MNHENDLAIIEVVNVSRVFSPISISRQRSVLAELDTHPKFEGDRKHYVKALKQLQKQLYQIQQAYFHQKKRAIIIFEGWDASGKGGSIRRLTEKLDPRGYKVHPIAAPEPGEQERHYMYRFFNKLPNEGEFCILDRSYYGRVLVERVEALIPQATWQRAYEEINQFEKLMTDDGVKVIKLFLHISKKEQLKRFEERLYNPLKRWKLCEEDIRNRSQWSSYEQAIEDMFKQTHTKQAPWFALAANNKWYNRLHTLEIVIQELSNGVDIRVAPVDTELVKMARKKLGIKFVPK